MFAAMVFDAAGYYKEAELYMRWMSQFVDKFSRGSLSVGALTPRSSWFSRT
jgi:hypothetical protein